MIDSRESKRLQRLSILTSLYALRCMRSAVPALMIAAAIALFHVFPAQAQALRTFVSGQGSDANPCSVAAPCRTFQRAFATTAANGEINVLDSADYGPLTITQGITIIAEGATAGITAANGATAININAGPSDVITLRGLDIEGQGSGANGIAFSTGGSLVVQNCVIRGFAIAGIAFTPTTSSALSVSEALVADNPSTATGILFRNIGSGSVVATLGRIEVVNSGTGISVQGSPTSGSTSATIDSSVVANNTAVGILANAPAAPAFVMVSNSVIANNGVGIQALNPNATVQIAQSSINGNITGLLVSNNGHIVSSNGSSGNGGNSINGNTNGNTVPTNFLMTAGGQYLLDSNGNKLIAF
jgi:hypothetical protein